jgi:competence protein ComEA
MVRTLLSALALASACLVAVQAAPQSGSAKPATAKSATAKTAASTAVVNINTASASDFEALPGIGAKTAARIIEYRQKNGPFKKIEELMNVRGLGEKNFLKLKAQLTIGTPKVAER